MLTLNITLNDEQTTMLQQGLHTLISHEILKMGNSIDGKKRYMNKKETCLYINISNNTLDSWIKSGFPVIKKDGVTRFDVFAVDEWLTKHA